MNNVRVSLRPIVSNLNLPTVVKTTTLPGEVVERLIIATQVGEIYYLGDGVVGTFLDIRQRILRLGSNGGYDERGLLGLAFHPEFHNNGLFYLHYSVAGTQGPGALSGSFRPNPCDINTLNLSWDNRRTQYDHIDTVEEWMLHPNGQIQLRRTLLNLIRPFMNHNGVNSLNFSPETGNLVLTTGDGGSGYDPFNLSQDDMEISGKIIEIDVSMDTFMEDIPAVSRFNELPAQIQEMLTVIAKGVRNIPGISYQRHNNQFIKYVGNVGQDLVESVFSFIQYRPIPVTEIISASESNTTPDPEGFINLGWRGWEGDLPTPILRGCSGIRNIDEKIISYYEEAIKTSAQRLPPLCCYYHQDPRPNMFEGTALTGVQAYIGNDIPELTGSVLFTDFVRKEDAPPRGILAYSRVGQSCKLNELHVIEVNYDFGSPAFYTCLGASQDQSRIFLGVYGSANVTDFNLGTVFEIAP